MFPSWVSSWCYQQMLDQTGKFLPGANTVAYLASSSATKKKSFITLAPGCSSTGQFVSWNRVDQIVCHFFIGIGTLAGRSPGAWSLEPGACTIKIFIAITYSESQCILSLLLLSIFSGSSLAYKSLSTVKVTDSAKRSSLFRYGMNNGYEEFFSIDTRGR